MPKGRHRLVNLRRMGARKREESLQQLVGELDL